MPLERRRTVRAAIALLLLVGGILITLSVSDDSRDDGVRELSATLLSAPELSLQFGRRNLSLTTTTRSAEHEAILLDLIADHFEGARVQTTFRPGLKVRPQWEVQSTRLVYLVAATDSAEATIDASGISIRGVSSDALRYQRRLEFLEAALRDNVAVTSDVLFGDPEISTAALCSRNFASITEQPIRFRQSSTAIRRSSFPLLDRLGEFAYECRSRKIAITGHTDATGAESWNLQVSRARAQAVADQLVARGVAAERLIIEGLGSQYPLAPNNTVQGRERNRRIEFELRER